MPNDDWEDEDWCDEDDEDDDFDEEESSRCPECGSAMYIVTDKCPECGYWLSQADRRAMWSGTSMSMGIRIVAAVVLLAFLMGLFAAGLSLF